VPLNTALSSTVISGYVDVAAQYNAGNYGPHAGVPAGTFGSKIDNFSLNDVVVSLDKPQDESPWAAGYHIDLNAGTDAVGTGLRFVDMVAATVFERGVVNYRELWGHPQVSLILLHGFNGGDKQRAGDRLTVQALARQFVQRVALCFIQPQMEDVRVHVFYIARIVPLKKEKEREEMLLTVTIVPVSLTSLR